MTIKPNYKHDKYPVNHGYDLRNPVPDSYAIIIHSTNGRKDSAFAAEEKFLYNSPLVSAHYLVGKSGEITQFLDVIRHRAWHAGAVRHARYNNNNTIGIECHYTPGESTDLPQMITALTNLVRLLKSHYTISEIAMHRSVAIPAGRKIDPSFWSDSEFKAWLDTVDMPQIHKDVPILGNANISHELLLSVLNSRNVAHSDSIVAAYTAFGEITTIGNLYPFAQAAHETGWFTSPRWIKSFNPAGLGATNDGAWGSTFKSASEGIMAQYAHLLCYATKPEDNTFVIERLAQLSPRIEDMTRAFGRGSAQSWVALNGKWAFPGTTYGNKIIEIAHRITA